MGKQIKGRCRRARENFPLSTGKFLKKNRPLPWRRIAYVEYPERKSRSHGLIRPLPLGTRQGCRAQAHNNKKILCYFL